MEYLAVLGRQPELGFVELQSLLGASSVTAFGSNLALFDQPLDIARLGGALKLARVIRRAPFRDYHDLYFDADALPLGEAKTNFGVSFYGFKPTPKQVQAYGLALKKNLRRRGSVRLILPKGSTLTSAQLKFNRIPAQGFELIVAVHSGEVIYALTSQIQDIDWYTKRDYGRPARSARVGMLPPKLAQILINTTGPGSHSIFDPFCGTGVVLQEALLMGRRAYGADLAAEMVEASRTNLSWLAHNVESPLPAWSVETADARRVQIPAAGAAIASEGYLGPPLTRTMDPARLAAVSTELTALYEDFLKNIHPQLEPGGALSICLPAWKFKSSYTTLDIVDRLGPLGYTLQEFPGYDSRRLIYQRPYQLVARQILIARKT